MDSICLYIVNYSYVVADIMILCKTNSNIFKRLLVAVTVVSSFSKKLSIIKFQRPCWAIWAAKKQAHSAPKMEMDSAPKMEAHD